jgi:hypothetical protein
MPTWKSFKAFGDDLNKVSVKLDATQRRKITLEQVVAGRKIADQFAERDLGNDRAFSRWRPGDPIVADLKLKPLRNEAMMITPTQSSAGIWTTINQGRNHEGGVGRFQGPGLNMRTGITSRTKSGAIRVRQRRSAVRWSGVTQGKHTARDAVAAMEVALPKIADRQYRAVLVKHFDVS